MKYDGPFIVQWKVSGADAKWNLLVYSEPEEAMRARDVRRNRGYTAGAWDLSTGNPLKGD